MSCLSLKESLDVIDPFASDMQCYSHDILEASTSQQTLCFSINLLQTLSATLFQLCMVSKRKP